MLEPFIVALTLDACGRSHLKIKSFLHIITLVYFLPILVQVCNASPMFKSHQHVRYCVTREELWQMSVDWSAIGATGNKVIHQLECGSCYAVATTESIQSALFLKYRGEEYIELSPQYIVDWDPYNNGCKGGKHGFIFAQTHGIPTEDAYPYDGYDLRFHTHKVDTKDSNWYEECDSECLLGIRSWKEDMAEEAIKRKIVRVQSFVHVYPSERNVLDALRMMPCYVSIAFRGDVFASYKNGVITKEYIEEIETEAYVAGEDVKRHAMLAVGMGIDQETGVPFMKFKNSWGKDFGENGFVRIEILTGKPLGLMDMYEGVYYPVV